MKLLFITLADFSTIHESNIYPDLLREFQKNKHEVYVISPIEKRKKEKEMLIIDDSVSILKLKIGNIQKTSIVEKGISTLLLEKQFLKGIEKYFSNVKFDLLLYSTPPITFEKVISYMKKRDNAFSYLLLKDIFPQNAVDMGMLKKTGVKGLMYNYFRYKEKKLYALSDFIGCMSQRNVDYILEHNPCIDKRKVGICPNSIEPCTVFTDIKEKEILRKKYDLPNDKTIFVYGGNLGKPQGIDFFIECIKKNTLNEVFFLIVGSGTEYEKLKLFLGNDYKYKAKLLPLVEKQDYKKLLSICDVGLIFLDFHFTIPNFPSRILTYMEAGLPVLAATDNATDLKDIIDTGKFGYWCESNNAELFLSYIEKLTEPSLRKSLGLNARKYLHDNYDVKSSYQSIMEILSQINY